MVKKIVKVFIILLSILLAAAVALVAFLSITEFNPAARETLTVTVDADALQAAVGETLTLFTWNIGYGGLGAASDFFMDGGEMVDPPSQQAVEQNMEGILSFMAQQQADAWLLQEVDFDSARTDGMDQLAAVQDKLGGSSAFAYNYKCPFVPIPLPPVGRIESGLVTQSRLQLAETAERVSLPSPFSWPIRAAQIKRCLLVTRLPLQNSDKELVLINLHLEAYDDGEGKKAQTELMLQVLQEEYAKGNYVIAGGDFNQTFPGALDVYPITDTENWVPGTLEPDILPQGWRFAYDTAAPTCRALDAPLSETTQTFVIDGFIVSPNVSVSSVTTQDLGFAHSDHNPVRLQCVLQ